MSGYPVHIIKAYRSDEISRQQFIKQFSERQKSRGINYDCKGTAQHGFVGVDYRCVHATIRDGVLCFITGTYTNEKGNRLRFYIPRAQHFQKNAYTYAQSL